MALIGGSNPLEMKPPRTLQNRVDEQERRIEELEKNIADLRATIRGVQGINELSSLV